MIKCLTKEIADKLKEAARRGEINIAKLYELTSQERRGFFEKYVDKENAQFINSKFEKAMISEDQNALKKWAEGIFRAGEKKSGRYQDILKKIDDLDEMGILTPESEDAFLQDLVASRLGATVTADEAKIISEKANKLQVASQKESEFGTPTIEYFKERKEMEDYLDSLTPSSNMKIATSIIARGTLLASFKSPLLNIESNTVHGLIQSFQRRIETRKFGGINNKYAIDYIKFVNKVFAETGYDISRMISLEAEKSIRGEEIVKTAGKGKIRAIGRFYEDLIFKKTQGAPDVAFSSVAFADRANLESTKIAKNEKLKGDALKKRSLEIFNDATRIDPKTPQGKAVRDSSIADAMYSTYTNKSAYSDFALGIRKLFNIASGDLRVGDQIMPFVKTPANVIGAGMNSSGILIPIETVMRLAKGIKAVHNGESFKEAFGENFKGFSKALITAGLGMTFAWLLSNLFEPDDYIGEYPTTEKERQLLLLKNATTNSVRIGNKWWSLDYFGSLGAPLIGFLYAKKYGKDLPTKVWEYYKGVLRQAVKLPGFDDFYNTIQNLKDIAPGAARTLDEEIRSIVNYGVSFVRARTIPALVSDIAKGTDKSERVAKKEDSISQIKAGIPGLRQTLPEKKNVFGETVKSEGVLSVLFFGARVKTVNDDKVIKELNRLSDVGYLPSITDVEKTSDRAKQLKEQIGDEKFQKAKERYGRELKVRIIKLINRSKYRKSDDEEKKKMIEKEKDRQFERMLKISGYRKPKKKK